MKDKPFALIGVNSDNPLQRARDAVEKNQLNWRSFQNEPEGAEQAISAAWAVDGWPTIVVLDQDMKIRYRGHDGHEAGEVAAKLVAALATDGGADKK